ncbi:MAG: HEAT repeat domain-containing protein [Planctomycetota bacterium]
MRHGKRTRGAAIAITAIAAAAAPAIAQDPENGGESSVAAYLGTVFTGFPAQTSRPGVSGASEKTLRGLIDPPEGGEGQGDEPSIAEMKRTIRALIKVAQQERLKALGESAGPALRAMVEESGLEDLARSSTSNVLGLFVRYAPQEALKFFLEIEEEQSYRYELFLRGPYSIDLLMESPVARGEARGTLQGLLDRALASETLDLENKMRFAMAAHDNGVGTSGSNRFIRENAVEAVRQNGGWAARVQSIVVPEGTAPSSDLEPRIAIALLDYRPEIENLTSLSLSPVARVRHHVASTILESWAHGQLPPGPTVDILARLIRDRSRSVESKAVIAARTLVSDEGLALSIDEMARLTATLADRQTDPHGIATPLAQAIHRTAVRTPEAESAKVGELYRTAFSSRLVDLHAQLNYQRKLGNAMPLGNAIAYFDATAQLAEPFRQAAIQVVSNQVASLEPGSFRKANATLDVLLKDTTGGELSSRFLKSVDVGQWESEQRKDRHESLAAISPERIPDALRWITTTESRVEELYEIALSSSRAWRSEAAALRGIAASSSEATRTRVFAHGIVLRAEDATVADADRMAAYFGECAVDPARRAEVVSFLFPSGEVDLGRSPRLLMRVTRRMVEDPRVPDDLAVRLHLVVSPETPEERADFEAALDAAEARASAVRDGLEFGGMSYYALREMAAGRSPVREALLTGWLLRPRYPQSEAITVLLEMEDNGRWLDLALDDLLAKLRTESVEGRQRLLVDQILRLPGDAPMQRMLEHVMRSDSTKLVQYVEGVVNDRLTIREASLRWSKLASGGGSVETAKVRLIRLLESDDANVRVAAVRALGTLGAVEAIPDLVELVGSDEEAIRAAALESLDLLHRQAAARVGTGADAPR